MKPCSPFRGQGFVSVFTKLYLEVVFLIISWSSLDMDHAGSKTKSLGQISLKPFPPSGGH